MLVRLGGTLAVSCRSPHLGCTIASPAASFIAFKQEAAIGCSGDSCQVAGRPANCLHSSARVGKGLSF